MKTKNQNVFEAFESRIFFFLKNEIATSVYLTKNIFRGSLVFISRIFFINIVRYVLNALDFSVLGTDMKWSVSFKGQLISKANQSSRGISQKTNWNTSHSSKNEFIRSFFGRILGLTVCFRN